MPEISDGKTVTSTFYYSNPATQYLTETNSAGVVTGMPGESTAMTGLPAPVTSQPSKATIPAGLPTGTTVVYYNASSGLTSFTISVGSSTTDVLGAAPGVQTGMSSSFIPAGQTGGQGGHTGGRGGATGTNGGNGNQQASASGSASASSTTGAASNVKVASAGMIGLGALFAALL